MSSSSPHEPFGSSQSTFPQLNFTAEEFANCLKVLSQVNAATTEQMIQSSFELPLRELQDHVQNAAKKFSTVAELMETPSWNGTTTDPEIITVLVNRRDFAFHYDARTSRLNLVQEVWEFTIISFLNVRELAMLRPSCRWCNEQWRNTIYTFRVPEEVPTIEEAMRVSFNLSKQKV